MAKNKRSGKVYVGQTSMSLNRRISTHISAAKYNVDTIFARALRSQGADGFEWSEIDSASSRKGLDVKERYWISFYKATDRAFGYNQSLGGLGGRQPAWILNKISNSRKGYAPWNKGVPCSESTRLKISEANKGRSAHNKGVPMSDAQKVILSDVMKGRPSPFKGKHHTDEVKAILRDANIRNKTRLGAVLTECTRKKIKSSLEARTLAKGNLPGVAQLPSGNWRGYALREGKRCYLGVFETKQDAYFAKINFEIREARYVPA